ncbi:MAG: LysR family transcriptional regulator [Hungatella sp.]|nr:LysR family transcriptional regulator [Hungatella sp.]
MTLKEQLYVCTLARCQTITKASEELCISQPALSTYISNLEKILGTRLFQRTGKIVQLVQNRVVSLFKAGANI